MKVCPKGHAFEDSLSSCPHCAKVASPGQAKATVYEDGPGAAAPTVAAPPPYPPPGFPAAGGFPPGQAPFPPRPFGRPNLPNLPNLPRPGGPGANRTVLAEDAQAIERLMGWLVVLESKQETPYRVFRVKPGVNFLGRLGSRSEVEVNDNGVSQQHAVLVATTKASHLLDLDSRYGTWVNGERMDHALLKHGDLVKVGATRLVFVAFEFEIEE